MTEAKTRGVRVSAEPVYVPERSQPEHSQYFFAYTITIANEGDEAVQLISRKWLITDGAGEVHEVEGMGVVGEQPQIEPGEAYQYTSHCPLRTPVGTMEGHYLMVTSGGEHFQVEIAPFALTAPHALN